MDNRMIDRMIAEKLMGWEYEEDRYGAGWKNDRGLYSHRVNCWNPSTRIEQAQEVINKLCYEKVETGFKLELFYKGYWATFNINGKEYFSGQQISDSLAICIAALKSVGIDYAR